ncbi:hypothetical protein, partial [Arthrobacter sp. DR-2P]
ARARRAGGAGARAGPAPLGQLAGRRLPQRGLPGGGRAVHCLPPSGM